MVADAAMLSEDNLALLKSLGLHYVVGARLKNLPQEITERILNYDFSENHLCEISLGSKQDKRLLVAFSAERANRDITARERQVKKLERKIAERRPLVYKHKYLLLDRASLTRGLDQEKIALDKRYDGLKGYFTDKDNPTSSEEIIIQYHNLWQVERAFRMSKADLRERPIYHRKKERIRSHLLLCFVSLLVTKETERILNVAGYSLEKAIAILGKVGEGEARIGDAIIRIDSELDQETELLLKLFGGH